MASPFLTALASIGSQYSEGRSQAAEEKVKRLAQQQQLAQGQARIGLEQTQQDIERQRLGLEQKRFAAEPDILWVDIGGKRKLPWSAKQGKFIDPKEIPGYVDPTTEGMQGVKGYIDREGGQDKDALTQTAVSFAATGAEPKEVLKEVMAKQKTLQAERDKLRPKIDPIISAQLGPRPDSTQFPQGENDPAYQAALKIWGVNAETIKSRMAEAMAEARGKGYGMWRPGGFYDQEGNLHSGYWGQAIAQGWMPAAQAFQVLPREVQMREMMDASANLRSAITNLQPGDAFTATSVAQMQAAVGTIDTALGKFGTYVPGAFSRIMNNAASASLNPRQTDYLIALGQMGERILSVRNVAGMGIGAQDLREAIQSTLPGITSGSKENALARLTAVDQLLSRLSTGIPRTNINIPPMTTTPQGPGAGTTLTLPGPTEMYNSIDKIIQNRTQKKKPPTETIEQPIAPAGEQ